MGTRPEGQPIMEMAWILSPTTSAERAVRGESSPAANQFPLRALLDCHLNSLRQVRGSGTYRVRRLRARQLGHGRVARVRARGGSEEECAAAVGADLGRAIGDPRLPKFAAILTAPSDGKPRTMKDSFDFGLQRVLDGIELYVNSMTRQSPRRAR